MARLSLVSSPDLIRRVYRFQYNARENGLVDIACIPQTLPSIYQTLPSLRAILKTIHAGVGFGSGTETRLSLESESQVHSLQNMFQHPPTGVGDEEMHTPVFT